MAHLAEQQKASGAKLVRQVGPDGQPLASTCALEQRRRNTGNDEAHDVAAARQGATACQLQRAQSAASASAWRRSDSFGSSGTGPNAKLSAHRPSSSASSRSSTSVLGYSRPATVDLRVQKTSLPTMHSGVRRPAQGKGRQQQQQHTWSSSRHSLSETQPRHRTARHIERHCVWGSISAPSLGLAG